jgi:hypothetical protein
MCSNKKAAFRRPGQYVKKMHNSSDDVQVFLAVPKIIVKQAFEVRLAAGKLKDAVAVALEIGEWVEFLGNEHFPSVHPSPAPTRRHSFGR